MSPTAKKKAPARKKAPAKKAARKAPAQKRRGPAKRAAPVKKAAPAAAARPLGVKEAPLVLVVDDYADAREMYCEYLEFSGFRTAAARTGVEALRHAAKLLPDIILMDLSLPEMDGWEATRRLKAATQTRHIPVVALTGHALAGHSETARAAGCDAFVAKPCLPEDLVVEIRRVLAQQSPTHRRAARRARS